VSAATPPAPVGYVALVRTNKRFRLLWFGQIISLLGDWFNLIASASLIAALTQSGTAVGGLFVVRMLAPFLVSPLAGVAADRYNRKHLLILTDILRGITVLGFLFVRTADDIWIIYALSAVQLGLSGFFFPARNAILPDITTKAELGTANALSSTTWSVMLAFGAALGGLAAGAWGADVAFLLDAATFFLSGLVISRIRYERPPALAGSRTIAAGLRQYVDGLRYLRQHLDVLFIALHKAANALLIVGAFQVVQVVLAEEKFVIGVGGSISLGLIYAFTGIGTGLGPILARIFTGDRDRHLRVAIAWSYAITAAGSGLIATLANFPVVLAGTLLRGIGGSIGWVFSTQLLLQVLPDQVRGRVFSTEFALQTLANAIGAAIGGWLLDVEVSIPTMMIGMSVLILLPGLLWSWWLAVHKQPVPAAEASD
jgi:MFS family permease